MMMRKRVGVPREKSAGEVPCEFFRICMGNTQSSRIDSQNAGKQRRCAGKFSLRSLGYPLSVFNK